MRGVENLVGVFDTEQARIIGVAAKGTTDVSYFAAQDTPTVGVPVTAVTDPVTGGVEKLKSGSTETYLSGANARTVIIDTDWWTDCDDVAAMRIAVWAEKLGIINIAAVGVDTTLLDGPASLDAFLIGEGRINNVICRPLNAHNPGGTPPYQSSMAINNPHRHGLQGAVPDAVSVYRRALSIADDNSVDLVCLGYLNNIYDLLLSSADSISNLSGSQLVAAKVRKAWIMGGKWPSGSENNFNRGALAKTSASYVVTNFPKPITFLGFEAADTIGTGGNLATQAAVGDIMAAAYVAHGSTYGRPSWDPLLMYLAVVGNVKAAGFNSVAGTASVSASTGENTFSAGSGNHEYVVKAKPDSWYRDVMDMILLPATQPKYVPVAEGNPILAMAGGSHIVGCAQPNVPRPAVGVDDKNLWGWWHANDLSELYDGANVSYWSDRCGKHTVMQIGTSRPTYAKPKNGRNAVAFSGTKALYNALASLPSNCTIYARVQWDSVPASAQAVVANEATTTTSPPRNMKLMASASGLIQAVNFRNQSGVVVDAASASPVSTSAWNVITGRRSAGVSIEAMVNGIGNGGSAITGQDNATVPLVFGAGKADASAEGANCWISEIRIYDAYHDDATVAAVIADMA